MENIVIGIEGLVGAGKTSICRELLNHIPDSVLLNGGNLYRAIISVLLENGNQINELVKNAKNLDARELMKKMNIEIKIEEKETKFYCNGKLLKEEDLQSTKSSMAVSSIGGIADNKNLFYFAKEFINSLKQNYNVIVSGRALMQIYPEMDYHFFITASIEQRTIRKSKQYNEEIPIEELKEHILKRDMLQEKAGFYNISPNTITIDVTECNSVEESTKKVLEKINIITV